MTEKLIILDIDETLIHATASLLDIGCDFEAGAYFVYRRPFLQEFIDFCFSNFKVAVWTTAGEDFAEIIVQNIFAGDQSLEFVWSRDRCTPTFDPELYERGYIKNLSKVKKKGFQLDDVIMIDDTPSKLRKNYGNLVKIKEFTGDKEDTELLLLIKYLERLKLVKNIRKTEKRGWRDKYHKV